MVSAFARMGGGEIPKLPVFPLNEVYIKALYSVLTNQLSTMQMLENERVNFLLKDVRKICNSCNSSARNSIESIQDTNPIPTQASCESFTAPINISHKQNPSVTDNVLLESCVKSTWAQSPAQTGRVSKLCQGVIAYPHPHPKLNFDFPLQNKEEPTEYTFRNREAIRESANQALMDYYVEFFTNVFRKNSLRYCWDHWKRTKPSRRLLLHTRWRRRGM